MPATDRLLFSADLPGEEGRHLTVTAERGYGEVVTIRVADNHGEFAIYLHDPNEVSWLGNALVDAWAALHRDDEQSASVTSQSVAGGDSTG